MFRSTRLTAVIAVTLFCSYGAAQAEAQESFGAIGGSFAAVMANELEFPFPNGDLGMPPPNWVNTQILAAPASAAVAPNPAAAVVPTQKTPVQATSNCEQSHRRHKVGGAAQSCLDQPCLSCRYL